MNHRDAGSANNTRHKAAAAGQLTNNMQRNENTKNQQSGV